MTPAALTPAVQDVTRRREPGGVTRTSSARSAGHRAPSRSSAAPRRVSGPATGTPRSRRVSGPVRGGTSTRPLTRRPTARPIALPRPGVLAARASAFVRALPDHRLLDRVVRGRSWIPILGLLLTGIVAMQVETLRLSASTGRSLERVTALQSRNQQLQNTVAVLADDQRIERLAAGMNMVMPGPTHVRFLAARGRSVRQVLSAVHPPNAAAFLAALAPASSTAAMASAGSATALPATPTVAAVTPAALAPATGASAPTTTTPTTGAIAAGVPSSSPGVVPTATSATNTGVASAPSSTATSPAASSGAPATAAPAVPTATTPNGAAGVSAGG